MKGKLDKETLKNLKDEAKSLVRLLKDEKGMTSTKIAEALNKEIGEVLEKEKSKDAIDKWYNNNENAPNSKEVVIIVETLKKIAGIPDHLTAEKNNNYGSSPKSFLVWVPFDMELPVADYNGINPPLSFIQMEEKKGIVIYRNTSKFEAEGELFVGQTGMASDIEPSTKIAIIRINKKLWKTDRYYVIIDSSKEISICELLPGDDEDTVRFVSTKTPDGPHKKFPFEEILVIFSIVDGNYIPTPNRKRAIAPVSPQQDQPPVDPLAP
jgi:hypothetical protein